jgi:hypothetical protein
METVMKGFENQARFYRAYLPDDRSLISVTLILVNGIAFWLLIYLLSVVGPAPSAEEAIAWQRAGAALNLQAATGPP